MGSLMNGDMWDRPLPWCRFHFALISLLHPNRPLVTCTRGEGSPKLPLPNVISVFSIEQGGPRNSRRQAQVTLMTKVATAQNQSASRCARYLAFPARNREPEFAAPLLRGIMAWELINVLPLQMRRHYRAWSVVGCGAPIAPRHLFFQARTSARSGSYHPVVSRLAPSCPVWRRRAPSGGPIKVAPSTGNALRTRRPSPRPRRLQPQHRIKQGHRAGAHIEPEPRLFLNHASTRCQGRGHHAARCPWRAS